MSINNGIVSSKIRDKCDDYNFEIVNFQFLDADVPRSPSYGVYISQLIRLRRICSNVVDLNNRNKLLTSWLSYGLCFLVFCHFPKCVLVYIRTKSEVGAV